MVSFLCDLFDASIHIKDVLWFVFPPAQCRRHMKSWSVELCCSLTILQTNILATACWKKHGCMIVCRRVYQLLTEFLFWSNCIYLALNYFPRIESYLIHVKHYPEYVCGEKIVFNQKYFSFNCITINLQWYFNFLRTTIFPTCKTFKIKLHSKHSTILSKNDFLIKL